MALSKFIYKNLKKTAEIAGFNFVLARKKTRNNTNYDTVLPQATYAPWLTDNTFNKIYEIIRNYSLVDKYRCYELWQLVKESAKLNGALIEVGAWRGGSGALIAKQAELNGIKDKVYLCDTFAGVVKAGEKDSGYRGGSMPILQRKKLKR